MVVDHVRGHVHEDLFQTGLLRAQLVQGDPLSMGDITDTGGIEPSDQKSALRPSRNPINEKC